MQVAGLQKLTLLDYSGLVACIVFTKGCNLRCPFCHNASLALNKTDDFLDESEVFDYLKERSGLLDGVVISGGEPLLQPDISDFLERVKKLHYKIKIDTNGTKPDILEDLISRGLADRVAVDIKNSPEGYGLACGVKADLEAIQKTIDLLMSGDVEYEFRTTVVKGIHTEESISSLAKWIKGAKEYYLQQFKDSGDLIKPCGLSAFSEEQLNKFADIVRPYVPAVQIRGI